MMIADQAQTPTLDPDKFRDPDVTALGEQRAVVAFTRLRTLWFNTGSLCNISCVNCYMDSTPKNDALVYLSADEVRSYLDEIDREGLAVEEIAFTGGEPFMNPDITDMLELALARGYRVLVLTNAMKPLHHNMEMLLKLKRDYGPKLTLRVSIDHFTATRHQQIRGENTWQPMMVGLKWLAENGFGLTVAGRMRWNEQDELCRAGYRALFTSENILVDANDPAALVLFPEMDSALDVPEITTRCWTILGVEPESMMCATSRMVVKAKGRDLPHVVPCTLLPYDSAFELGTDLAQSTDSVKLNHPHCAKFCVLGGASCSAG
mgnify:CR=1 FL=1